MKPLQTVLSTLWNWKWHFSASGDFFCHLLTRKAWNWTTIVNCSMKRDNRWKNSQKSLVEVPVIQAFTPFKFFILFHTKLTLDLNLVSSALHPFLRERRREQEPKLDILFQIRPMQHVYSDTYSQLLSSCVYLPWHLKSQARNLSNVSKRTFQEGNQSQNMHVQKSIANSLLVSDHNGWKNICPVSDWNMEWTPTSP